MKRYNTEALILKSINLKDSDKMYTLLTKDFGKLSAMARGVRKITSRRAGSLDTINHISVSISETQLGHKDIVEVTCINSYKIIKQSLDKSLKAYYLSELVNKTLMEGIDGTHIFRLLTTTLEKIETDEKSLETAIANFEVNYMKMLGYGVDFNLLINTEKKYLAKVVNEKLLDTLDERFKSLEI
jgi:DNA repair protein RecO (recombination protein O)